jgi:AcrR family transcriptional regulator
VAVRGKARGAAAGAKPAAKQADEPEKRPLGRRERNKLEKRARIVAAARRLFGEKGFQETTTQEIAEAADIGIGTLFLYARSKEDLLVMVFRDEMIETAHAAFARLRPGEPLLDQLMRVFQSMMDYHGRDVGLARILLKEIMFQATDERMADITGLLKIIYAGLAELLVAARKAGAYKGDADPLLVAEVLFANYYMDLLGWLGGRLTKRQTLDAMRKHLAIVVGCAV